MKIMIKPLNIVLLCSIMFFAVVTAKAQDLNIGSMIQPIPKTAKFIDNIIFTR